MRISDWSSDVCSSDLNTASSANLDPAAEHAAEPGLEEAARTQPHSDPGETASSNAENKIRRPILSVRTPVEAAEARVPFVQRVVFEQYGRSEERRVGKECVSTCRSRWSP